MIFEKRWGLILAAIFAYAFFIGCGGDEDKEPLNTPDTTTVGSIQGTISPTAANAEVRLLKNGQLVETTKADANGDYTFANLQPNAYEIQVVVVGYKQPTPETVTVSSGQRLTKNFTLERLVTVLKGIVVAPDGIGLQNATVTIKSATGEQTQNTSELGVFTFEVIWADVDLTVTVQAEGMLDQNIDVEPISNGDTVKLQVDMVAIPDAPDDNPDEPQAGSQVGDIAPDFTLSDINGNLISLSDYRGEKVVLLNFNRGQF